MPYTLDITIDGTIVTDNQAKIVCLFRMGLGTKGISSVTFIKPSQIHKETSDVYGRLRIDKCPAELQMLANLSGFDYNGCVHGVSVLSDDERRRFKELNPRLLRENVKLELVITKL